MIGSSGKDLFDRVCTVTVGDLEVSDLRVSFKAKKNLRPEPNTCEISVYNLNPDHRERLQHGNGGKLTVRLEAGYKDTGTAQIFLGEARSAYTTWDGPDAVTVIATGDGEKEMREARLHLSVGPFVPADVALTAIASTLGVGTGNLPQALALLKTKGVTTMFGQGSAISGNAARQLTDFCRSAGLEWSIQDGQLQILDLNRALSDLAIELSPDTGLLDSPTFDFNSTSKKKQGGLLVKAKCLLIPELAPGRKVSFSSKSVSGGFRIEEIEYECDTHDTPWFANITARKY